MFSVCNETLLLSFHQFKGFVLHLQHLSVNWSVLINTLQNVHRVIKFARFLCPCCENFFPLGIKWHRSIFFQALEWDITRIQLAVWLKIVKWSISQICGRSLIFNLYMSTPNQRLLSFLLLRPRKQLVSLYLFKSISSVLLDLNDWIAFN